jgi:hypothetical protein
MSWEALKRLHQFGDLIKPAEHVRSPKVLLANCKFSIRCITAGILCADLCLPNLITEHPFDCSCRSSLHAAGNLRFGGSCVGMLWRVTSSLKSTWPVR